MSVEKVAFTRPAAERIARAVRIVEAGGRDASPLDIGERLQDYRPKTVRLCSWTGSWQALAVKQITFLTAPTVTVTAKNVFMGVDAGSGVVIKDREWCLVAVNMTTQPGYIDDEMQLFGHDESKIARWYSVYTCATATT